MAKKTAVKEAVQSFEDKLNNILETAKTYEREQRRLEEQAREQQSLSEKALRQATRLNRIAYMATWNSMDWRNTIEKFEGHSYHGTKRIAFWELDTSTLDFDISLNEDLNLKKWKYVVKVTACKRTLGESPSSIHGGYTDHDYGKNKYMTYVKYGVYEDIKGQELTKKFAKQSEAEAYVEQWKNRLCEDHKELIEADKELLKLCVETGFKYDDKRRF